MWRLDGIEVTSADDAAWDAALRSFEQARRIRPPGKGPLTVAGGVHAPALAAVDDSIEDNIGPRTAVRLESRR